MKIDLLGSYHSLRTFVAAPEGRVTRAASAPSFELPVPPASGSNLSEPLPLTSSEARVMGRLNLPTPLLMPPAVPPLSTPEAESSVGDASVKETPSPVKPPSILDARRVPSTLHELPYSERVDHVRRLVDQAGMKHGVDPALGLAVASAESSFDPHAISSDGHSTKGLFQLKDGTGQRMLKQLSPAGVAYDPLNPELNVELGVGYLRYLHDIFSEPTTLKPNVTTVSAGSSASLEKLAIAAFNAGEGRVAAAQQRAAAAGLDPSKYENVHRYLPDTTQKYVQRVVSLKAEFAGRFIG